MSEAKNAAVSAREVLPFVMHWTLLDDRIDHRSDSYALRTGTGRGSETVLIDPLRLHERALGRLGNIAAICLTIQSHQRSAWRYRHRFGVPVYAPRKAEGLLEEPNVWYDEDTRLPGGLRAMHAPGPCDASFVLVSRRPELRVVFVGDLLVRDGAALGFVPDGYMDDPARARDSARRLLRLKFDALAPGHGAPITHKAQEAVKHALVRDERTRRAA